MRHWTPARLACSLNEGSRVRYVCSRNGAGGTAAHCITRNYISTVLLQLELGLWSWKSVQGFGNRQPDIQQRWSLLQVPLIFSNVTLAGQSGQGYPDPPIGTLVMLPSVLYGSAVFKTVLIQGAADAERHPFLGLDQSAARFIPCWLHRMHIHHLNSET